METKDGNNVGNSWTLKGETMKFYEVQQALEAGKKRDEIDFDEYIEEDDTETDD